LKRHDYPFFRDSHIGNPPNGASQTRSGYAPRKTADGFPDQRSERRTGRGVQMPLRVHPRIKANMLAVKRRDNIPSLVVLLEEMLEAYLKEHGPIDEAELPTLEQLAEAMEQQRDKRDG
jgi:hypothetical protein